MAVTATGDAFAAPAAMLAPLPRAGEQIKLLFGLKWRLLLRGFRRSTSAWVGALLFLLVFGPIALGAATGLGFAWVRAPAPLNAHLLRAVLFGVYLFWLLAPLLGYALNDSYDITRLFVFPISVRRLFAGTIFGALLDLPTLLVLPTLLAAVIAFGGHGGPGAFALSLLATLLFLFHTLALSQALILASAGVLRSRRFRDIVMVVLPLFWIAYYIASQTLSRRLVSVNWRAFLSGRTWDALSFLPPGLAARSLAAAGSGDLLVSLGYLVLLALATALTVYAAGWLVQAVYAGEDVGVSVRPRPRAATVAAPTGVATSSAPAVRENTPGRSWLPPVVEAMAGKELLYLRRDPYFKVTLMNLVYMMVVGVFAFLRGPLGQASSAWGLWGASGLLLWGVTGWLFNQWGTEGGAAPALFSFPSDRRRMILGKNLPLYGALVCVNAVFLLVLCAVAGRLTYLPALLGWASLALVVLLAAGNLVSIWFPYRVVLRGWRRQRGTNQGFAYGFLYLGFTAVAAGLLLPILAAFVIPLEFAGPGWLLASVPLAALYAAGLYLLSLHLAVPLLQQREQAMIEKLTQSGE